MTAGRPTIALSSDFLKAFARLPRPQQRAVRALIARFKTNSTASGLNYERIHAAGDPAMRSVRIGRAYRAILLKPEHADVHVLLWADKHERAYAWAARHKCRINVESDALRIYESRIEFSGQAESHQVEPGSDVAAQSAPFGGLQDSELLRLGVPAAMLAEVRRLQNDAELNAMQPRLPWEAYEALFLFMAGYSYEEVVLEQTAPAEPVHTDNTLTALLHRAGQLAQNLVAWVRPASRGN